MRRIHALFTALSLVVTAAWAAPPMKVRDGWVKVTTPGASVTAAYFTLENLTDRPMYLLRGRTPVAAAVELHTVVREEGMLRMRPLERVEIPARGAIRFEPGSHHVMLIGVRRALAAGSAVPLTLTFSTADSLVVRLPVRDPASSDGGRARGSTKR